MGWIVLRDLVSNRHESVHSSRNPLSDIPHGDGLAPPFQGPLLSKTSIPLNLHVLRDLLQQRPMPLTARDDLVLDLLGELREGFLPEGGIWSVANEC